MTIARDRIEAVLRSEDVEGFLKLGAPSDEYSSEAGQIAAALAEIPQDEQTQDKITAIIALIWAKSFGLSVQDIEQRLPAFQRIAHSLFL